MGLFVLLNLGGLMDVKIKLDLNINLIKLRLALLSMKKITV